MNKNNLFKKIMVFLLLNIGVFLFANKGLSQEILFSVLYGTEDDQIDMYIPDEEAPEGDASGPSWFFVDSKHDVIYIDVKKFKTNGEFIGKIKFEESQLLEGIRTCWVDNEENVYIMGKSQFYREDQITKLNKEGKIIWTKRLSEIVSNNKSYESMGSGINIDTQGNVILEAWFRKDPKDDVAETRYLKLDKDGNFLGEVPSYHIDKNGNYYVFTPIYSKGTFKEYFGIENYKGSYKSGADIEILNPEQKFVGRINISLPEEFKQFENCRGVDQWDVDFEGNIYVCAFVDRDSDKETKLRGEIFSIVHDNIVYKFNQEGKFVSQIKFPGEPIYLNKKIHIDEQGNIYYLQFHADKMDMVKVSSDNIAPYTSISVSPFPNIAGWNNSDVTITLTATDNEGGSGVKEIHYKLAGAIKEEKTVPNATAIITVATECITTLTYYAVDNAGNMETTKSFEIKIDKTAPLISLNLEPYKIKLPFRHEHFHFYIPFFYKLVYSANDNLSGVKDLKAGLVTPDIDGFKTQLIQGKHLQIVINETRKHLLITAPNPQEILNQLKTNLFLIANNQIMHLNQRPKAKVWTITKVDKFLVIVAPTIMFKAEASDNADNSAMKELKYEKKKIPLPHYVKPLINRKEFSPEEIEDLMEDMTIDEETQKIIRHNYKIK